VSPTDSATPFIFVIIAQFDRPILSFSNIDILLSSKEFSTVIKNHALELKNQSAPNNSVI